MMAFYFQCSAYDSYKAFLYIIILKVHMHWAVLVEIKKFHVYVQ